MRLQGGPNQYIFNKFHKIHKWKLENRGNNLCYTTSIFDYGDHSLRKALSFEGQDELVYELVHSNQNKHKD